MMKNSCHHFCIAALLLLAGIGGVHADDKAENKATKAKPHPGLAVHYYRDDPFWGGNWTTDFLPKVSPEKWVFSKYLFTRAEELVNHSFVNRSWFSLRAVGQVLLPGKSSDESSKGKEVTFFLVIDHGARLLVDGNVVVDAWQPKRGGGREITGKISLTPGKHSIVLEGFVGANNRLKDGLILKLLWESDGYGIKKGIVPAKVMSHNDSHLLPKPGRIKAKPVKKVENP
jgi:hypothetical protein